MIDKLFNSEIYPRNDNHRYYMHYRVVVDVIFVYFLLPPSLSFHRLYVVLYMINTDSAHRHREGQIKL